MNIADSPVLKFVMHTVVTQTFQREQARKLAEHMVVQRAVEQALVLVILT